MLRNVVYTTAYCVPGFTKCLHFVGSNIWKNTLYDRVGPQEDETMSNHLFVDDNGTAKNPITLLNEKYPPPNHAQFREYSGSRKSSIYKTSCQIKEKVFFGHGKTSKEAKMAAAKKALETLLSERKSDNETEPMECQSVHREIVEIGDEDDIEGKASEAIKVDEN